MALKLFAWLIPFAGQKTPKWRWNISWGALAYRGALYVSICAVEDQQKERERNDKDGTLKPPSERTWLYQH